MTYIPFTDDPVADAEMYQEALEEEEQEFIEASPKCACCGKPVAEADGCDCYWLFGSYFCVKCIDKARREIPDNR